MIERLKNYVIKWRCNGNVKIGNLLQKAIEAYQKSRITSSWLQNYFTQLKNMEK